MSPRFCEPQLLRLASERLFEEQALIYERDRLIFVGGTQ